MQIQVESVSRNEHGLYVTASCGKVSASVGISRFGVQVCCHNAANRAWRGLGRRFETIADAIAGYRSEAMRSIIETALRQAHDAILEKMSRNVGLTQHEILLRAEAETLLADRAEKAAAQ